MPLIYDFPGESPQDRAARLAQYEAQLQTLTEELQRRGEALHQQVLDHCATQISEAATSTAEASSRMQAVIAREAAVSAREEAVKALDQQLTIREGHLAERDAALKASEQAMAQRLAEHHALVSSAITSRQNSQENLDREREQFEQSCAMREAHLVESSSELTHRRQVVEDRETLVSAREVACGQREAKLKEEQEAHDLRMTSDHQLLDARALLLARQEQAVDAKSSAMEDREQSVSSRERAVADVERHQQQVSQGLEKSKMDIEVRDAEVTKKKLLVDQLINKRDLSEELKSLTTSTAAPPRG